VLVLLVDFPDQPANPVHDKAHFERLLFSTGEIETGSLRDYFLEATWNRIDITGEAHGWYRMPWSTADYAGGEQGLCRGCFPNNARHLAADAVRAADAAGVDLRRYDNDGPDGVPDSGDDDGILDALLIVHAGSGSERTGNRDQLRSHYWNMTELKTRQGLSIPDYALVPETDRQGGPENVGVSVHEFGHILGGDDLYDLSGRGAGVGYFSVMGAAIWYNGGKSPGGPDPLTRMQWGVLTPETPGANEPDQELPAINDTPFALRLWTRGRPETEYFLVENRRRRGIDRFLPGEGLVVYHVDERIQFQNNPEHYRIRVVEADGGNNMLGAPPRDQGMPGDLFPGTTNRRVWDGSTDPDSHSNLGAPTLVGLRDISDAGEVMTAHVEVGRNLGSGPRPRARLEVWRDPLDDGGRSPSSLRLVVENLGTRLRPGTVSISSLDPLVEVRSATPVIAPPIAALDTRSLDNPVLVTFPEAYLESRDPRGLLIHWKTDRSEHIMSAPIPTPGSILLTSRFETSGDTRELHAMVVTPGSANAGFHSTAQAGAPSGDRVLSVGSMYPAYVDAAYGFEAILVTGPVRISFRHRYNIPGDERRAWDGGWVEVSVDEGPWTTVSPAGGYPANFVLTQGNAYAGHPAWSGTVPWRQETLLIPWVERSLGFRFRFVSDFSPAAFFNLGWWIDDLQVRTWTRAYTAGIEAVRPANAGAAIDFVVAPFLDTESTAGDGRFPVRLVQTRPGERLVLGTHVSRETRRFTVFTPPLRPGQTYTYSLETEDGRPLSSRAYSVPGTGASPLLTGLPPVLQRSRGARYEIAVPGSVPLGVRLELFDVSGRRLALVEDDRLPPGLHERAWTGRTDTGRALAAGVYFLRLQVGEESVTRRLVLLP